MYRMPSRIYDIALTFCGECGKVEPEINWGDLPLLFCCKDCWSNEDLWENDNGE